MAKSETLNEPRQKFEEIAREMFGASVEQGPYGNLLDRDSHFPDEYKFADVQAAWVTFKTGIEVGRLQGLEEAAQIALEQRCERNTPWDLACKAVAAAMREKLRGEGHGKG